MDRNEHDHFLYEPVIAYNQAISGCNGLYATTSLLSWRVMVPSKSVKKMILGFDANVCGNGILGGKISDCGIENGMWNSLLAVGIEIADVGVEREKSI